MLIRHRKHNSGPRFANRAYRIGFSDDEAGETPAWTRMQKMAMKDLTSELQEKRSVNERLADLLEHDYQGSTVAELSERLGVSAASISKALVRSNLFFSEGGGKGRGNAATWHKRR